MKVKTYYFLVLLGLSLTLLMGEANAFTCRTSDGGVIPAGGSDVPIPVRVSIGPNLVEGKNEISNVSQVTCKNDISSWTDYLKLNSILFKNTNHQYGVTINGIDYDLTSPIVGVQVLSVTGLKTVPLPMQIYIRLKKNPTQDYKVKKGDMIALLSFYQTNDQSGCPKCGSYRWHLIADNDAYFTTTACTINGAKQMNVEFGQISQDNFSQSVSNSIIKKEQDVTYHCADSPVTQDILVRFVGDVSGFSSDAIRTSNADIGIAMVYKGNVVKPSETFKSKITNGMGGDTLTFVPIKSNTPSDKIATGPFSGSGTLIFSAP
ncbi:fimbrial protein [Serratia plymuthica]|jgi:type 1 fimbria pilin|uniref:fimbrial protein n=1 Tax=Serratia plymuthica TaxID=82996 RepID=UPI0004565716|nr:fimbrial protein [Serratia plymuthica]AHY09703.1 minor fimbrial protein MrfF [Serratia plymuthica]MEB6541876.1 fimbrial protein [Serratia plymuthica]